MPDNFNNDYQFESKQHPSYKRKMGCIGCSIILIIFFLPFVLMWFGFMEMISEFFDFWRNLFPRF